MRGYSGSNHHLVGGLGNDTLRGSIFAIADYSNDVVGSITIVPEDKEILASDGSIDTIRGIGSVVGSSFGDEIRGMRNVNAGDGDDTTTGHGVLAFTYRGLPSFVHYRHYGEGGNDTMTGSADIGGFMDGGDGDDILVSLDFKDVLVGGEGRDTLSYAQSDARVTVNLLTEETAGGHARGDRISGFENAEGSVFSDTLFGDQNDNTLIGNEGDDEIHGHHGDDRLLGGAGEDLIRGRNDNDTIFGGDDNDRVLGDAGNDRIFGEGGDDIMKGGEGNDYMIGGAGADRMYGGMGDDVLQARSGEDVVFGDEGNDILRGDSQSDRLYGGEDDDYVDGAGGNDVAEGGSGNDTVLGGNGSDLITGGTGNDVTDGGIGNNTFVFNTDDGSDRIRDWSHGNNQIDFSGNIHFSNFADVQAVMVNQTNGHLRIDFDATNEILLLNTLSTDLNANDFIF